MIIVNDQEFAADNVVLATGGYQAAYVPDFAGELDDGIMQLHSSEYRTPSQLRDVTSSLWALQTRERRSRSRHRLHVEPGSRAVTPASNQPAQEAGSTVSSPRPSGFSSPG
jgi:hypothetical protein